MSGGVFGSDRFKNAGRQKEKRGWKYTLSRAFPPAYQVKGYYSDTGGREHKLMYYYGKRLLSCGGRRTELKKQMKVVLSSNTEYLNTAGELFRLLEL